MQTSPRQGGYNIPLFALKFESLRVPLIHHLVSEVPSKWRPLALYFTDKHDKFSYGKNIFATKPSRNKLSKVPLFHRSLINTWQELGGHRQFDPRTASHKTVMDEFIFNNNFILDKDSRKPLFFPVWVERGVLRLRDICYEVVPGFLSPQAVNELLGNKVPITTCTKQLDRIRAAIPKEWRLTIRQSETSALLGPEGPTPTIFFGRPKASYALYKTKQSLWLCLPSKTR